MTPEELFRSSQPGKLPALLCLRGDNPYLAREWKKLLQKAGLEVQERELKRAGPDASSEDLASGMSLFQAKQVVWLRATSSPTAWSAEGKAAWERLRKQADGESLWVAIQAEADKRVKWENLGVREVVDFQVEPSNHLTWLKRMNEMRGGGLAANKLRFLASFDAGLLTLDNWVELWTTGGDLWAERSLGWGQSTGEDLSGNPVFAWVDAVLAGRRRESLKRLKKILEQGEEPLQLIALLAKSVRILATLEAGKFPKGQPDFLVQKLQKVRAASRPGHGKRLLRLTAEVDRLMKSSPAKASSLLMRM